MAIAERANWEQFTSLVDSAKEQLTICTPFFSSGGIQRIFDVYPGQVPICFITRLSPLAWVRGITDPEALEEFLSTLRSCSIPASLFIHPRLHAKVYIADRHSAILGSANLSDAGFAVNFELIVSLTGIEAASLSDLVNKEVSESCRELSLEDLSNWIDKHKSSVLSNQAAQEKVEESLTEAQRDLDALLGYGRKSIAEQSRPSIDDFVTWLETKCSAGDTRSVLLDHYHNHRGQNRQGHFRQCFYGLALFFSSSAESRTDLELPRSPQFQEAWIHFLDSHATAVTLDYDFAVLRNILPPRVGGNVYGGGGAIGTFNRMALALMEYYGGQV